MKEMHSEREVPDNFPQYYTEYIKEGFSNFSLAEVASLVAMIPLHALLTVSEAREEVYFVAYLVSVLVYNISYRLTNQKYRQQADDFSREAIADVLKSRAAADDIARIVPLVMLLAVYAASTEGSTGPTMALAIMSLLVLSLIVNHSAIYNEFKQLQADAGVDIAEIGKRLTDTDQEESFAAVDSSLLVEKQDES